MVPYLVNLGTRFANPNLDEDWEIELEAIDDQHAISKTLRLIPDYFQATPERIRVSIRRGGQLLGEGHYELKNKPRGWVWRPAMSCT